ELGRRAPGAVVLVQVNVSDQPQRGGAAPAAVPELVVRCRGVGLDVAGLMAVGPPGGPELAGPGFALVRRLADTLGLAELSMGMSDDLEVAVAHGATMVRVGTALFGPRPRKDRPEGPAR
ncbi:MAG: alanine racemase, partial [Acidimicrobiia bacterium]